MPYDEKKQKPVEQVEQVSIEEWCLNEGKDYLDNLKKEADAIVEILKKAQQIDPQDLQKPCTI